MLVHLQETNGNIGLLGKFDIMKNLIFLFLIPLIGFGQINKSKVKSADIYSADSLIFK